MEDIAMRLSLLSLALVATLIGLSACACGSGAAGNCNGSNHTFLTPFSFDIG
jgi:hypothetical protein